ncbi:MAG: phosphatidylglycerophosphatase A [Alphaproteobacteria bacterium]|nr:phosphatidylglycerophosphatase A [Alphaproteobacteria bacterium]
MATVFGTGLLPIAPGTWGSAVALPFGWIIADIGGWQTLLVAAVIAALGGWWASSRYVALTGRDDPSEIVIDEVAAQWFALCVVPTAFVAYFAAFFVFRLFDTIKPWPASWADREVGGGFGVMLDDLIAGAYSVIVLAALHHFQVI